MTTASSCPESVLASIAWYPDGLSPEERAAVETHAADCRSCRDELAFVRGDEEPAIDLPDAEDVYARVLARIESHEQAAPSRAPAVEPVSRNARRRFPSRPAALAAGIAIAALAGVLGGSTAIWLGQSEPRYETASVAPPAVAAAGAELEVVFRADATADEIHTSLRAVDGSFVSGPTKLGVYRVRLPARSRRHCCFELAERRRPGCCGLRGAGGRLRSRACRFCSASLCGRR